MSDTPSITRKYPSPTTPGLEITLSAWIIEQLCLNAQRGPLQPRFWREKTWSDKWRREVRGVKALLDAIGTVSNDLFAKALVEAVRCRGIYSLMPARNRESILRYAKRVYHELKDQRDQLTRNATPVTAEPDGEYVARNARFMDTGSTSRLERLKEAEVGCQ